VGISKTAEKILSFVAHSGEQQEVIN